MATSRGEFELRPNTATRRRNLAFAVALAPAVLVGAAFAGAGLAGILVAGSVVAALIVLHYLSQSSSRIVVTPDEITVVGLFVRRRRTRSRVAAAVVATMIPARGPMAASMFLLDADGKVVVRVYGRTYDREDFDRLVEFLSIPCSRPDRSLTAKQLSSIHPGIAPWAERRPVLLALVAVAGLAVVIVLMTVLVVVL